jgi:hypothetical protein
MARNKLKNYYYYKVIEYDENKQIKQSKLYITRKEITEEYGISIRIINFFVGDPNYTSRKVPNLKILKIKEPVFKTEKIDYNNESN